MFETFALIVIDACGCIEKAADLLDIGWDAVQTIMERGVERGLERRKLEKIHYVGIDEKSFKKGQSYVSLLNDLKAAEYLKLSKTERHKALMNCGLHSMNLFAKKSKPWRSTCGTLS